MLVRGPMAVRYEVTSLFYDKTDTGLRSFLRKLSVRLDSDQETTTQTPGLTSRLPCYIIIYVLI